MKTLVKPFQISFEVENYQANLLTSLYELLMDEDVELISAWSLGAFFALVDTVIDALPAYIDEAERSGDEHLGSRYLKLIEALKKVLS